MKKYLPIFLAVFFFTPLSAFANVTVSPQSYTSGSDVISIDGGATDAWMSFFAPTSGTSFVYNENSILSGTTNYTAVGDLTNQEGTFHILVWNNDLTDYDNANNNGTTYSDMLTYSPSEDITITFGSPSPPTVSAIDDAIATATSSFRQSYGFDLDEATSWMWDNLGQPILGSGIGTLVVMKWYWLGFIAIAIAIFFAFGYFRFFKK
jgi:hypothetical protein